LKIDRSFINNAAADGEGMEIARTIMPMAKNLRLDVVAEGVETVEQVALLKRLQCRYAQGYYFSRPLAPKDIGALLCEDPTWEILKQTR
jgi:EAL domain-containing protein (putative c-di-GMP-specific phosphodiesterase class I)